MIPRTAAHQASLSFSISRSLLKLMFIQLVMPSNYVSLCLPFSSCPQSFLASGSFPLSPLHIRWPKYWGFSFNISPSNEYTGLISFRIDWCDHRAYKRLKSSPVSQFKSINSSAIFLVQLPHPYLINGKTITLTFVKGLIQIFVNKVMSLLFNMLSRTVIAFPPRSKHLLILLLQSPSIILLEYKNKIHHCFHFYPMYLPSDGARYHDLSFSEC